MDLDRLNEVSDEQASAALLACCGSTRWARAMAEARPFADREAMMEAADRIWASLDAADWLEAFAAHPRIGAGAAGKAGGAAGAATPRAARVEGTGWADDEQAGARIASSDVRQRLALANHEYEARFGYIFIVCATGKTGDEMLALLERRLRHPPDEELAIAAEEQRKITRLRLGKLLTDTRVATS
jgi:OHCU decarboxylase